MFTIAGGIVLGVFALIAIGVAIGLLAAIFAWIAECYRRDRVAFGLALAFFAVPCGIAIIYYCNLGQG